MAVEVIKRYGDSRLPKIKTWPASRLFFGAKNASQIALRHHKSWDGGSILAGLNGVGFAINFPGCNESPPNSLWTSRKASLPNAPAHFVCV